MSKVGRKVHVQAGLVNQPGMWDNLGSGMICTAPLEVATHGRYVIAPGDVILGRPISRQVATPIDLRFDGGVIVDIGGGLDARTLVADRFPKDGDASSRAVAHAGWGMHPDTVWNNAGGQDAESFYGSIMVSLGSNIFDTPHPNRGFGGTNDAGWHIDICCRNASLYLDDEPIVVNGEIVPEELR
jgi:2,5-dihydroxypyridine 5,6-dioxygenase